MGAIQVSRRGILAKPTFSYPPSFLADHGAILNYDFSTLGLSDGAAISSVPTTINAGNSLSQATSGKRPSFVASGLNNLGTGRFSTSGLSAMTALIDGAIIDPLDSAHIKNYLRFFMVAKYRSATLGSLIDGIGVKQLVYRFGVGTIGLYSGTVIQAATTPEVLHMYTASFNFNANIDNLRVDGTSILTGEAGGAPMSNTIIVGDDGNNTGAGCGDVDIGQIVVAYSSQSTTDRDLIEEFLKAKWATP